jgi:hypothetical protein
MSALQIQSCHLKHVRMTFEFMCLAFIFCCARFSEPCCLSVEFYAAKYGATD